MKLGDTSYDIFKRDFKELLMGYMGKGGGKSSSSKGKGKGNSKGDGDGEDDEKKETKAYTFFENVSRRFYAIDHSIRTIKQTTMSLVEPWAKVDKAASQFAKHIGMSANGMAALRKQSIELVKNANLGIRFNIRPEELIQLQESYSKAIGRSVAQNNEGLINAAAMRSVLGEDKTVELTTKFEKFGISMTEAGRRAGQMYSQASKYGLNFEVYSENFLSNIELAQKYTFKDGLHGLSNMAKKATEVRLNMSQAAAFADKVSTVEGAITTGAGLQVLGGQFAQFANPMQMLYEGLNDMESLQDRMVNMFGGLGTFNKKTGETQISSFNRMRIKAATDAMGIDYGNIMEMINRKGVENEVSRQMSGLSQFQDEDFANLVKNVATIENGIAGVNINGEFRRLSEISEGDVNELKILRNSESDNIKDIAQRLRSWDDVMTGFTNQKDALKADLVERTKIGEGLKHIVSTLGELKGVLSLLIAGEVAMGLFNTVRPNIPQFRRGGAPTTGTPGTPTNPVTTPWWGAGTTTARVGGALSAVGGGIMAYKGIDALIRNKEARRRGEYRRGSSESNSKIVGNMSLTGAGIGGLAALGAKAGLAAGPIGAAIGAVAGVAIGAAVSASHKETKKMQDKFLSRGFDLKGDYNRKELKTLEKALLDNKITLSEYNSFSDKLKEKMKVSGDMGLFPDLKDVAIEAENSTIQANNVYVNGKVSKNKAENGGLLVGPSHISGGMPIQGSNIEVEGGEYVVNKKATKANLALLNSINKMGKGGIIKPRKMENGGAIPVKPSSGGSNSIYAQSSSISVAPINLNVNGSIRLDDAHGNSVDFSSLLKNQVFVRKMSQLVEAELNKSLHGGMYLSSKLYANV